MSVPPTFGAQTIAIHAGDDPDPVTRASSPNIVMSSTFIAEPDATFSAEGIGGDTPFFYTRWANPTVADLEAKLAALEGAEASVAFSSGMAAISALLLQNLKAGDHLVISDVTYAATAEFTKDLLPQFGITVSKVDASDLDELEKAIRPNTKLVYLESPANPILRLTDIESVAKIAHEKGVKVAVDSTFATPVGVNPLKLGADFVAHSLTKYICGHGDALGGAVLGKSAALADLRKSIAIRTGGCLSPFNAWLIARGASTLPLRMKAHEAGAKAVAAFLESHPKVARTIYPGLESHPQHALAKRQMRNFSGMVTFQVHGDGVKAARVLADNLRVIHNAVSLGHHRSLVFYLPTADMLANSFNMSVKQEESYRRYAGDGIFRLSVGLEDPEDLIEDLSNALEKV